MDFRTLSRRELQALCKRNKIPANITNIAMADALAALPSVEGIEEFLNGDGSRVPESPMKEEFNSEIPRTALRTSTRRKTVKDEPITTRTRRAAAAKCTEESENSDLNVALTTPSLQSGRRRTAAASSACKKVDFQMTVDVEKGDHDLDQEKDVIEKTPAVPKSQKRVVAASTRRRTETRNSGDTEQRVYSTRRSVRLLEKNMESLSLGEDGKMEPITVHMSFDEMPNSTGPMKEDTDLEIESKKTDESESKIEEDLELEIDDQKKNELESEVKLSEVEPEMDLDSMHCSAENLVTAKSCDDSETEAPGNNLDVKCFSEVEEANEASKDDDAVEISAEQINDSDQFSLPTEDVDLTEVHNLSIEEANEASKDDDAVEISAEEINDSDQFSLPTEDVDLTEVHNLSIAEESGKEVEQSEPVCESECISEEDFEEEEKLMNISAELTLPHENVEEEIQVDELVNNSNELSLPHENVEEETQVDDVLSSGEESVMEVKDDQTEYAYESEPSMEEESLEADIEGNKKEIETDIVSIRAEEDGFPENDSEDLVDVKIQLQSEEAPKDINVDAIDSQPKIPNDIQCEEALVEVSVISTEETIPTSSFVADQLALANQFPRPTAVTKSPLKDQTIKLLIDNSDSEDEDEKEQEKSSCIQRQNLEKNDMSLSLRQLKKMFKEQLQLSKKKMDNNNTKVVGGGKVRTALQPLPENRMAMNEPEKRF